MSKPCPIRFSGRVLAPCVLGGHGGHSALLQEERGREPQLQTPLRGIVCVVILDLVSCKETKNQLRKRPFRATKRGLKLQSEDCQISPVNEVSVK